MNCNSALIAIALAAAATPVSAQGGAATQNRAGNAATTAKETKYCVQLEQMVGSRLNREECKTKREWAREGVDIDKLVNK